MSVSILDALRNAQINFQQGSTFSRMLAFDQLDNAITLLDKGYSPHDQVDPLIAEHGDADKVPPKPPEYARCGCCGSQRVAIRGRHPHEEKRVVCPTCLADRLDIVHQWSDPNYGQAVAQSAPDYVLTQEDFEQTRPPSINEAQRQ